MRNSGNRDSRKNHSLRTRHFNENMLRSREVVDIFIFAGIFQKVAEMSLKKVVDRGYIFMFFIFIVFLLTNIFNFFKKSLKFQMFKFLSLIFVRFTKSHWESRWFSKNFGRNFPTFRRPTISLFYTHTMTFTFLLGYIFVPNEPFIHFWTIQTQIKHDTLFKINYA